LTHSGSWRAPFPSRRRNALAHEPASRPDGSPAALTPCSAPMRVRPERSDLLRCERPPVHGKRWRPWGPICWAELESSPSLALVTPRMHERIPAAASRPTRLRCRDGWRPTSDREIRRSALRTSVLAFHFPDNFLDDILDGDDADRVAFGVDDDGDRDATGRRRGRTRLMRSVASTSCGWRMIASAVRPSSPCGSKSAS